MKNLSPGRLARPLKKPKYQQSQVYNQSPGGTKEDLNESMQPNQTQKPRERSHELVDNALSIERDKRNYIKSAQQTNSNERPQTLNERTAYRYNGRGPEPRSQKDADASGFTDQQESRYIKSDFYDRAGSTRDQGGDDKYHYSRMGNDTYDWTNATQQDQSYMNGTVDPSTGYEDVRQYRNGGRDYSRDNGYASRGHSQEAVANPYYENRSPSPRLKKGQQESRDFGMYNPVLNKKDPKPNPLVEPDSGLSSVLDEVEDDFRLTIFKMKPEHQKAMMGGAYARNQQPFDAFRMMGRGTVPLDHAAQALNRVLRPLGLPDQDDMVNRFHRY